MSYYCSIRRLMMQLLFSSGTTVRYCPLRMKLCTVRGIFCRYLLYDQRKRENRISFLVRLCTVIKPIFSSFFFWPTRFWAPLSSTKYIPPFGRFETSYNYFDMTGCAKSNFRSHEHESFSIAICKILNFSTMHLSLYLERQHGQYFTPYSFF